MIFCFSVPPSENNGLLILNSDKVPMGKVYGYQNNSIYRENSLIVFTNKDKLLIVDPEKAFSGFNNMKPDDVSDWINKRYQKDVRTSLLEKYQVQESFYNEIKYLFKNK